MKGIIGAALAVTLAVPSVAEACGGFFCDSARPVDQAAEEILFAVDEDADTVTMHVSIQYQGPAEEFAWIVPVPTEPTLQIGTDALFPVLSTLRAQFTLTRALEGCFAPPASSSSPVADNDTGAGGVTVVSTGVVGPYETVVLQASSSDELIGWLQDNGFDLPSDLEPLLAPYVADGQHFVALRLAKDRDAGDLEPLVVTYPGDGLAIPIQLTSVAATPDMGLRVYVLGAHRAVPQSYLHLVLNELAIDWWTQGANLEAVIDLAADEAGGHGFFTDYSGSTDIVRGRLHRPEWDDVLDPLSTATGVAEVLNTVIGYGLPLDDALMGVISDHTGLSATATPELDLIDVLNCLSPYSYYGYYTGDPSQCYPDELAAVVFDPAALAADMETAVLEPRRRTDALLDAHPRITRLTSSLSPAEMTVDPTFVFNPSLPDVALGRTAVETLICKEKGDEIRTFRTLTLSDGREVSLPLAEELVQMGLTEIEWLEQNALTEPTNLRIEQTGPEGAPEVIADNTELLWSQLGLSNDRFTDAVGCGCSPTPGSGAGATGFAGLVALLAVRRRANR